jgi:hypothetical protein
MAVIDLLMSRWRGRPRARRSAPDGKAGARYERVLVDGEPYFVKRLSPRRLIMRVTGDHVHRPTWWQDGIMDAHLPASITRWWPCRSAGQATTPR